MSGIVTCFNSQSSDFHPWVWSKLLKTTYSEGNILASLPAGMCIGMLKSIYRPIWYTEKLVFVQEKYLYAFVCTMHMCVNGK